MKDKTNIDLEYRINEIYPYGIKQIIFSILVYIMAEVMIFIRFKKVTVVGIILLAFLAIYIFVVYSNDSRHRKIIKLYNDDKAGLIEFLNKRKSLEVPDKSEKIDLLLKDIEADNFY